MFLHSKFSMGAIRIGSIITGSSYTKLHSQSICNPSSSPLLNTQAKHWSTSPLPYVHHQIVKSPCMCHHHLRHSKIIFLNLNHNRGPHTTWYAFLSLFPLHVRQFLVTRELCHRQWSQLHSPHTGYTSELFASFIYALSPKPINSIQLPRSGRGSIGLTNTFIALCADLKELSRLPIWSDCFKWPANHWAWMEWSVQFTH